MSDHNRSTTFTIDGGLGNASLIISVIEMDDGTLHFSYVVDGDSELRGLFFDFNNSSLIDDLTLTGDQITKQKTADEGVTNMKGGNNMEGTGEAFDVGATFGSSGRGRDQTTEGSFILSADDGTALTLDDIANVQFGARLGSDGDKLVTTAPAAPDANDDTITTNEDTATDEQAPNTNLLANDTDADNDLLTIVAVNGDPALVGTQFALATGGLLTLNSDGTFDLDPNGAYEDLAVGESRTDSFTYRITDELVDPNNQGFDTATADITITGLNDAPVISIQVSNSAAETVVESNGNLTTSGTLTVYDADLSDVVKASVFSVVTSGDDSDVSLPSNGALLSMLSLNPVDPAVLLDGTENTDTLNWAFDSGSEAFNYLADDESLTLDYTVRATDDNGAIGSKTVSITVDGTNDRPVASNVDASLGEDTASVTASFVASDLDTTDILSFQILGDPMDAQGHQYGQVTNNNDGTFSFDPLDNFQFLEAGESRDVTFQYVAIDDSGTATDTSVAKTATITVNGADDAPINLTPEVLFESNNQSMWETGDAIQIDWRDFYGISWDRSDASINETIIGSTSLQIVPSLYWAVTTPGIPEICDPTPLDLGCTPAVPGFTTVFVDYDGYSLTTPSISLNAGTSGRIGISPYFQFNSGDVDSSIPIDVDLTYEVQYEDTDTVSILTGFTLDNAAYFNTASPSISFGMDMVFEFAADASIDVGSSSAGGATSWDIFDFSIDYDEAEAILGVDGSGDGETANLLNFSSITGLSSDLFDIPIEQEDGVYTIPVGDSSLDLSLPYIATEGTPTDAQRLTSTGEDDVAVLTLDLDEILSESTKYFPPMRYRDSDLPFDTGLVFEIPDVIVDAAEIALDVADTFGLGIGSNTGFLDDPSINILSAEWDIELIDVDLIGTLTAVQDFTLDIEDIPLLLTLENDHEITGFKLGETIEFDIPDWDVDNLGDMDGQMDYTLGLDMDALFNNWTTLDFSLDLLARALKAQIDITSDLFTDFNFDLAEEVGAPAENDGFIFAWEQNLVDQNPLATLFGDEDPAVSGFDLEGWGDSETYTNEFDIA